MDSSDIGPSSRWRTLFWLTARPATPDQEPWRRLALRLHHGLAAPEQARSVMIVTVGKEDSGARACLELAAGYADELGKPILVVDAAPAERSLSVLLDCAGRKGLTDKLFEPELPLADIVLPTTHPNVSFVAAGDHVDLVEHVAAERATALFDNFSHSHDLILLCGGRVPQNSLALALAPLVGCVLIIATEDVTKVDELDLAEEALRIRKAREIGLVVAPSSRGFM